MSTLVTLALCLFLLDSNFGAPDSLACECPDSAFFVGDNTISIGVDSIVAA